MSILERPVIHYFRATPDEIMADEEVLLEWEVEKYRKLRLDGIAVTGENTYHVYPGFERTYELVASGFGKKTSQQLTIRLFRPEMLLFEASTSVITEGVPLDLRFLVKHALSWQLVADYNFSYGGKEEKLAEGKIENGHAVYEHKVAVLLKGACMIRLKTNNGHQAGMDEIIRVGIMPVSVKLKTDQSVVRQGDTVRVSWISQNARRLVLNPGNIDVTQLAYYDLVAEGDRDIELEIIASGDFGQKEIDTATVWLARINKFESVNNADPANPEFYLNWNATGLQYMKLLPDNCFVHENGLKHKIPASNNPVTYTLTGQTVSGEPVSAALTLQVCTLSHPQLENGSVIIGRMAKLKWKASNARLVQIQFPDTLQPSTLPGHVSEYEFQARKEVDKVKLVVWGDVNVVMEEIAVPRFKGPEIGQLSIPSLSLRMGITWLPSPVPRSSTKVQQLFSQVQRIADGQRIFQGRFWKVLGAPSALLFHLCHKIRSPRRKQRQLAGKSFYLGNLRTRLGQSLYRSISRQLKKLN
jgi:hypothetical protein